MQSLDPPKASFLPTAVHSLHCRLAALLVPSPGCLPLNSLHGVDAPQALHDRLCDAQCKHNDLESVKEM